jgi:hypothetical protein
MPIADVIERLLADASSRIFGRRRIRIERWMLYALGCLVARRFPVADAGTLGQGGTLGIGVNWLRFQGARKQTDRLSMGVQTSLQREQIRFLEIAIAGHHVELQHSQIVQLRRASANASSSTR